MIIKHIPALCILMILIVQKPAMAEEVFEMKGDPHYNAMGFFDIHLCNWPERPNFFKILFSSEKYQQIESMNIYTPDDRLLATLDKEKFRKLKRKNKADKRVYILDIDVPDIASTGWYRIDILTRDGIKYHATDYVLMTRLERVSEMQPSEDSNESNLPVTLRWKPVAGSQYYQAFVRDIWTDELVFQSKLVSATEVEIPADKLVSGGSYAWTVHARDTNEHVFLGDFHMGSMSKKAFFNIVE